MTSPNIISGRREGGWEMQRSKYKLGDTWEEAGGDKDCARPGEEGGRGSATVGLQPLHRRLPGGAITPALLSLHCSVCSAQSEPDHSATQRERRVAQQDARTSQAKVKPKLSVGAELPVQTLNCNIMERQHREKWTQCDTNQHNSSY